MREMKLYGYRDLHRLANIEGSLDMNPDEDTCSDGDSMRIETYEELQELFRISAGKGHTALPPSGTRPGRKVGRKAKR